MSIRFRKPGSDKNNAKVGNGAITSNHLFFFFFFPFLFLLSFFLNDLQSPVNLYLPISSDVTRRNQQPEKQDSVTYGKWSSRCADALIHGKTWCIAGDILKVLNILSLVLSTLCGGFLWEFAGRSGEERSWIRLLPVNIAKCPLWSIKL